MTSPTGGGGTKKWLLIGISVAILGAVGAVLVLTVGGGGGGGQGSSEASGMPSPEDLLQTAIDRAERRDVAGLTQLSITSSLVDAMIDCKDAEQATKMRDGIASQSRKNLTEVDAWKGVTATVMSIEPDGRPEVMPAGKLFAGCKMKTDVRTQRFRATIKSKMPDGSVQENESRFTAMQVSGRWYLERLPENSGDKMKKMKDAMCVCKDAQCVDQVQKEFADFMKSMEEKYKGDKKPDEDMMRIGEEMAKCMTDAMVGGGGESAVASVSPWASDGETGVPECDAYLRTFNKYMSCDKLPRQAVEASKQGIAQMKAGWAMLRDPDVPAEAKKAAADACRKAVDALEQSARAMGCRL